MKLLHRWRAELLQFPVSDSLDICAIYCTFCVDHHRPQRRFLVILLSPFVLRQSDVGRKLFEKLLARCSHISVNIRAPQRTITMFWTSFPQTWANSNNWDCFVVIHLFSTRPICSSITASFYYLDPFLHLDKRQAEQKWVRPSIISTEYGRVRSGSVSDGECDGRRGASVNCGSLPAAIRAASIDLLLIVVNASAFAVLWNWILIVLLYRQGLGIVRHSIYYCWLKSIIFFYVSALNKFALF